MSRLTSSVLALLVVMSVNPAFAAQAPPPQGGAAPVDEAEGGGAVGTPPVRIGAAVLNGSVWLEGSKTTGDAEHETSDGIRIRRARVGLAGNLTPRIGWSVTGELTSQPALRNAFIVLHVASQLDIRVGQATPVTALERGSSPQQLELIDRSAVTSALTGASDIGITFRNPEPYRGWLGYALNISNGAGFNRADDNDAKDVSGRIALTPPALGGLMVVVSGARGEQPKGLRTRSGIGVEYRTPVWRFMAERLRQVRDNLPASDGYFAMAAYRYRPRAASPHFSMLEVAARFAVLNDRATAVGDPSDAVDDDGSDPVLTEPGIALTREFQAGVNYYVTPNARVMGNVAVPVDERQHPGPSVLMRLQILF